MKIRNRITLWFTMIAGAVFLVLMLLLYLVTSTGISGVDEVSQRTDLRLFFILSWILAVVIIFFTSRWLAKKIMRPVSQMADKAGEISATNLHLRLSEADQMDEMSELAASFNNMLDRLENSFDAQREFVSNISHELRTPLTAITGELQLLLAHEDIPEELRLSLLKILDDARRLSRLSTGLMDMAKANYVSHQISQKRLRLDELIMEARSGILRNHPQYHVRVQLAENLDNEDKVTVRGNSYLLIVAFKNLIDNACKFSDDQTVVVSLEYDQEQKQPVVSFTDQGQGISEEEQQKVFNPFYRGSNSSQAEGSGIGLSIVQRIVSLHQADLDLDSRPGAGTTIRIRFPGS